MVIIIFAMCSKYNNNSTNTVSKNTEIPTITTQSEQQNSTKRFLEDDIVTFYGTYDGLYTYETILGASVTIPSVTARYMTLH